MRLPERLKLDPARRRRLIAVAAGREPADLVVRGGRVLNVFTGALRRADVGIAEGRVAWVSADGGKAARRFDARGLTIVPGLIDPHCHADVLCTFSGFARAAVLRGTTAGVADMLGPLQELDDERLRALVEGLSSASFKFLWGPVPSRGGFSEQEAAALPAARLERLLEWPGVSGSGELTAWPRLVAGDERVERFVDAVTAAGLRLDGHLAGASPRTLGMLAAAGITSDHEAITGEELLARIELGYWTMVRYSSLRRDAVALARALVESGRPTERVLLAPDGVVPEDLSAEGHADAVVRRVIEGGVPPAQAVRMATLNPATYLGLDAHLGAVAPGRCADLVLVDELETFQPRAVLVDGEPVSAQTVSGGEVDWEAMRISYERASLDAEALVRICRAAPAIEIDGVIARAAEGAGAQPTLVALVRRDGTALVGTTARGLDVRAFASTHTDDRDVLLLGRDPRALLDAYHEVVAAGGGIAVPELTVPLPVLGYMSTEPVSELGARLRRLAAAAGREPGELPLAYVGLFLTLPVMPGVAVTRDGLVDVRSGRTLAGPTPVPVRSPEPQRH